MRGSHQVRAIDRATFRRRQRKAFTRTLARRAVVATVVGASVLVAVWAVARQRWRRRYVRPEAATTSSTSVAKRPISQATARVLRSNSARFTFPNVSQGWW